VESSRAWPPHRPRESGLAHPADPSRSRLAALGSGFRGDGFPNQARLLCLRKRPELDYLAGQVCKLKGAAIRNHLSLVPRGGVGAEPVPIIHAYIDLNLQSLAAAPSAVALPVR
jgi:hypothetical protein